MVATIIAVVIAIYGECRTYQLQITNGFWKNVHKIVALGIQNYTKSNRS